MRGGGVAEFIADGQDGLLADDDRQLAQHIGHLCVDTALRNQIAMHNRKVPVAFTWQRTLAAHLATYERARYLCRAHARRREHIDLVGQRAVESFQSNESSVGVADSTPLS